MKRLLFAMALVATGAGLIYLVNKRKFLRTNKFGAEEFQSYGKKVAVTAVESITKKVGIGLLIAGLLVMSVG